MRSYIVSFTLPNGSVDTHTLNADTPEAAATTVLKGVGLNVELKKTMAGDVCNVLVQTASRGRSAQTCYTYANINSVSKRACNIFLTNPQGIAFALSNITDNVIEFKSVISKSIGVAGLVSAVNRHKRDYISPFRLDSQEDNTVRLISKDKLGNIQYLIISYE